MNIHCQPINLTIVMEVIQIIQNSHNLYITEHKFLLFVYVIAARRHYVPRTVVRRIHQGCDFSWHLVIPQYRVYVNMIHSTYRRLLLCMIRRDHYINRIHLLFNFDTYLLVNSSSVRWNFVLNPFFYTHHILYASFIVG